jgi:hypothetical protein
MIIPIAKIIASHAFKIVLQELAMAAVNVGVRTARNKIYNRKLYPYEMSKKYERSNKTHRD